MSATGNRQDRPSEENGVEDDTAPDMEIISQLLTVIASIKYHRQQVSLERLKSKSRILGLTSSVIEKQLELAVKHGLILKLLGVNGLWSYADPNNVNIGRFRTLQVDEKTDLARIVQRVVRDIGNCNGSNLNEIEVYVRDYYDMRIKGDLTLSQLLRDAVAKAVDQGLLVSVSGDRYQLPYKGATSSYSNGAKHSGLTSKRKSGVTLTRCYLCKGTKRWNQDGVSEGLLVCCTCRKRAHPSCLHLTPELADRLFAKSSWHCSTCKACALCGKSLQATSLRCDGCDKGYHKVCISSATKEKADSSKAGGFWFCPSCKADRDKVREKKIIREAAKNVKSRYKKSRGRPFVGKREEVEQSSAMTPTFTGDMDRGSPNLHCTFVQSDVLGCPPFVDEKGNSGQCAGAEINDVAKDSSSPPTLQPFDDATKSSLPVQWSARLRPRLPPSSENGPAKAHSSGSNGRTANDLRLSRTCKSLISKRLAMRGRFPRLAHRQPKLASFADLVTKEDELLFKECQRKASHSVNLCKLDVKLPYPRAIVIGKWVIDSWYSAPYPQEYARLNKLYVCEFCLKYMKSNDVLTRHIKKCKLFHPPGDEIYRKDSLSFFEVDGCKAKIYCQNLCLLAKVYLDHKTLYYDVEPFLFYVLTMNDAYGCHLVGYFSKEKYSSQKFNVSCIVTLPPYQNKGFGRLQIAFSYLLSRKEGEVGTPEKPLSELGRFSYTSYWKSAIFEFFDKNRNLKACNIKRISETTGMTPVDIVETMQSLNMIVLQDNRLKFVIDWNAIDNYMIRARNDPKRVNLDEQQLRWLPHVTSLRYRSLQSLLACSLPTDEETTAPAALSQSLHEDDHSNVTVEASPQPDVSTCSPEPTTLNGPSSLKEEEQAVVQANGTPTLSTTARGGRRRKRRKGRTAARVQSRDLAAESLDSDSDSSRMRTRTRKRPSCQDSVRRYSLAESSSDSSDSTKQTSSRKRVHGTGRFLEGRTSASAKSPSKSTTKPKGSSGHCRVAKDRKGRGSVCGDGSHSDERRGPSLNSNSLPSTKGKFSSLNGGDIRGSPNELLLPSESSPMINDNSPLSREMSPEPDSSESTNGGESPPPAPPSRLKTTDEDSEVDTDTEIQQLTIGSVEKMTEDEPPKLVPMTMDCVPSSPDDAMPKLCRAVDSYGTSSPDAGPEAKKQPANLAQRERRQSTCSSVKSVVSIQGDSDVPPDLQQMTPSSLSTKADTPVDVADTVKAVEARCKSNVVASPSLTADGTPQQPLGYENGPLSQSATTVTEYSRCAYSAVPLKQRHQSVPLLKEKQSSEVSALVCNVRRASDSKQNRVIQSPDASLSPYAVNPAAQMPFPGGVVSPTEFSPDQLPRNAQAAPHLASAVVQDGGDGVDSNQRFSGYAVGQSLPKQNELASSQSVSTDCCFGRSVPPSSITYDNFNKLCHYADPIGQSYGMSSSFAGLPTAVPMNNAHSAATFVNNTASNRGYPQAFATGSQSGAAMAQYPSQAACYYYRPKNSSCLSQPGADILPALNSNFYVNAAYMQPTAAAAMFGSPAGYFQSNSAAAAAFMATNHHHHTQSMQMSMMGFPQGNFQDGSPAAAAGAPSNPLYYNYLTPAMMSGMRR